MIPTWIDETILAIAWALWVLVFIDARRDGLRDRRRDVF
jgi:hypothetical protein